jgi:cyclohexadieny/prephenate dehydrogenase
VVAAISHLPHLVAYVLVTTAGRLEPTALEFAAGGFKDTTRIAAADPGLWEEIFRANREALLESVGGFRDALGELERLIVSNDGAALAAWLAQAKQARDALT